MSPQPEPASLLVRPATADDLSRIADFNVAMALETEDKRLDPVVVHGGVEHALQRPEFARYYVAERGGRVIGQCMITFEWSDWRDGLFWWIQSVYVHPEHRGKGVFKQLFEHVRGLAQSEPGVCGLRLYVESHNQTAISSYRRLGMNSSGHVVYELDWSSSKGT